MVLRTVQSIMLAAFTVLALTGIGTGIALATPVELEVSPDPADPEVYIRKRVAIPMPIEIRASEAELHFVQQEASLVTSLGTSLLRNGSDMTWSVTEGAFPSHAISSEPSSFQCVQNGHDPDFYTYQPQRYFLDTHGITATYIRQLYAYDRPRWVQGVGYTFQALDCIMGGARARNGYRLTITGAATRVVDDEQFYTIGADWENSWEAGNSASGSLTFGVSAPKVPVSISATIGNTPTGRHSGQYGLGPYAREADVSLQSRNSVDAWWENVSPWYVPRYNRGSRDWQSSVTVALWEFPRDTTRTFEIYAAPYLFKHCTTQNGQC